MLIKKIFSFIIEKVFFNRLYAVFFCIIFSLFSYIIECKLSIENFFEASGTVFTIAGLFLNIKLTAHFHLKDNEGKPLSISNLYSLITNEANMSDGDDISFQEKLVNEVLNDEVFGISLMVVGTFIWGYGSYFI